MGPISVDAALTAAHLAPTFIRASTTMLGQRGRCGSRLHARHRAASGELSKAGVELAGGARCYNTAMGCDGSRARASKYSSTMHTILRTGVRKEYFSVHGCMDTPTLALHAYIVAVHPMTAAQQHAHLTVSS